MPKHIPLVSVEELKNYFHMSLSQAAVSLKMSTTTLKRICRELGIEKWPFRTVHRLKLKIEEWESKIALPEVPLSKKIVLQQEKETLQHQLNQIYDLLVYDGEEEEEVVETNFAKSHNSPTMKSITKSKTNCSALSASATNYSEDQEKERTSGEEHLRTGSTFYIPPYTSESDHQKTFKIHHSNQLESTSPSLEEKATMKSGQENGIMGRKKLRIDRCSEISHDKILLDKNQNMFVTSKIRLKKSMPAPFTDVLRGVKNKLNSSSSPTQFSSKNNGSPQKHRNNRSGISRNYQHYLETVANDAGINAHRHRGSSPPNISPSKNHDRCTSNSPPNISTVNASPTNYHANAGLPMRITDGQIVNNSENEKKFGVKGEPRQIYYDGYENYERRKSSSQCVDSLREHISDFVENNKDMRFSPTNSNVDGQESNIKNKEATRSPHLMIDQLAAISTSDSIHPIIPKVSNIIPPEFASTLTESKKPTTIFRNGGNFKQFSKNSSTSPSQQSHTLGINKNNEIVKNIGENNDDIDNNKNNQSANLRNDSSVEVESTSIHRNSIPLQTYPTHKFISSLKPQTPKYIQSQTYPFIPGQGHGSCHFPSPIPSKNYLPAAVTSVSHGNPQNHNSYHPPSLHPYSHSSNHFELDSNINYSHHRNHESADGHHNPNGTVSHYHHVYFVQTPPTSTGPVAPSNYYYPPSPAPNFRHPHSFRHVTF